MCEQSRNLACFLQPALGSIDFNQLAERVRLRHHFAILAKAFYVEVDCLTDQSQHFLACLGSGNTPWQIRNVSAPTRITLFNNYRVLHRRLTSLGQLASKYYSTCRRLSLLRDFISRG